MRLMERARVMSTLGFFEQPREQSEVKKAIVSKYFWAWAKVIMPTAKKAAKRVAYIDLFAGPGRYEDGTQCTPLLILAEAKRCMALIPCTSAAASYSIPYPLSTA